MKEKLASSGDMYLGGSIQLSLVTFVKFRSLVNVVASLY